MSATGRKNGKRKEIILSENLNNNKRKTRTRPDDQTNETPDVTEGNNIIKYNNLFLLKTFFNIYL